MNISFERGLIEKQWKCPYCHYWWPVGQKCKKADYQKILKKFSFKQYIKSIGFVLFGLLLIVLFWQLSQNRMTSLQYLDQQGITYTLTLPVQDKEKLSELMQKLFALNSFAYTILGSKPISWETYQNPLPLAGWTKFCDSFSEHSCTLRSGWKTWEKYKHLFPSARLLTESPKCHPGSVSIFIINENRFNDVVNENKNDFQEVLCREIANGLQLLKEAENRSLINEVLEGHQGLIGVVLGYGRNNSWKFLEGCQNRTPISWVWEQDEGNFFEKSLEPETSLIEYYLSHYSCPSFAGDPHSAESLRLKEEYLLTKQKVIDYYKNKDFLEATLSLLAGYVPTNDSAE